MNAQKRYRFFLALLAIAGSLMVWLATSSYGPGLSTDGARYLSTAESIAAGNGITDYLGLPLVNWPPLYPLIIAAINLLTGLDVFIVAQIINIFSFGSIIFLGGVLFERSLPGNWVFGVVASLILATSLPLLEVSANVASDPLFLIAVLIFLLVAQDYAKQPTRANWILLVVTAIMSSFLRYAGLAMIFSGIVLIFFQWRGQLRKAFTEAAVFGIVAGAPLAAWAIFHNFPSTGTFLGSHRPSDFIGLFIVAVEKVAGWFVPERLLQIIPALIVVGILIFAVIARSSRTRWSSWSLRIQQSNILPSAIFFAIYGAMLVLAISYSEHRIPGSQRIHAVILPALLVLVAITWQEFAPRSNPFWGKILVAVFAIWLMFPLYRVTAYVSASMQSGDISFYNLYNTRTLRESDIVSELSQLDLPNEEKIYSNNEGAAWFYLRRRIYRLPRYDADSNQDLASAILEFEGWPDADETATLVWFKRELDYKEDVPTPEQLQGFIRLSPTFTGRNGAIYLLDVDPK